VGLDNALVTFGQATILQTGTKQTSGQAYLSRMKRTSGQAYIADNRGAYRGEMTLAEANALVPKYVGDHATIVDATPQQSDQYWNGAAWIPSLSALTAESGRNRIIKLPYTLGPFANPGELDLGEQSLTVGYGELNSVIAFFDTTGILRGAIDTRGSLLMFNGISSKVEFYANLTDSKSIMALWGDGSITWGPGGSTVPDTGLARPSAQPNVLALYSPSGVGAAFQLTDIPTPAAPPAGHVLVFANSDVLNWMDPAGNVHALSQRTLVSRFLTVGMGDTDGSTSTPVGTAPDIIRTHSYADAATQGTYWAQTVPQDWASGPINYSVYWVPSATDAASHAVRWSMDVRELAAGSDVTAASGSAAVPVNKDSGSSTANTPIITANNVAYQNNRLYLVTVETVSATAPTVNSISGGGITWVRVDGYISGNHNCEVWRGLVTSGATTGKLTFTLSGNPTNCAWSIEEVTGMDTSGTNGSGAIVQHANNGTTTTAASGSVALGSFADATNNVAFGAFLHHTSETSTVDPDGYTALANLAAGSNTGLLTEYKTGQDLSVDASWATSSGWSGVALEIKSTATITAWTGIAAARTANLLVIESSRALITPSAPGNLLRISLRRLGSDAADTYAGAAQVVGMQLTYTATT